MHQQRWEKMSGRTPGTGEEGDSALPFRLSKGPAGRWMGGRAARAEGPAYAKAWRVQGTVGRGGAGQGEEVGRLPRVKAGEFAENRVTPCFRQLGLL